MRYLQMSTVQADFSKPLRHPSSYQCIAVDEHDQRCTGRIKENGTLQIVAALLKGAHTLEQDEIERVQEHLTCAKHYEPDDDSHDESDSSDVPWYMDSDGVAHEVPASRSPSYTSRPSNPEWTAKYHRAGSSSSDPMIIDSPATEDEGPPHAGLHRPSTPKTTPIRMCALHKTGSCSVSHSPSAMSPASSVLEPARASETRHALSTPPPNSAVFDCARPGPQHSLSAPPLHSPQPTAPSLHLNGSAVISAETAAAVLASEHTEGRENENMLTTEPSPPGKPVSRRRRSSAQVDKEGFAKCEGYQMSPTDIRDDVLELMLVPLPTARTRGLLYIFKDTKTEGKYVKIGITTDNLSTRKANIETTSGRKLDDVFWRSRRIPYPQLLRLEALVHKDLAYFQRLLSRKGRRTQHEWFEVEAKMARDTAIFWYQVVTESRVLQHDTWRFEILDEDARHKANVDHDGRMTVWREALHEPTLVQVLKEKWRQASKTWLLAFVFCLLVALGDAYWASIFAAILAILFISHCIENDWQIPGEALLSYFVTL